MNYLHHPHSPLRCLILVFALSLFGLSAQAQERTSLKASFDTTQPVKIDVLVGQSRVIDFDGPIERVSVSGEKVVEAVPITPTQVLINASRSARSMSWFGASALNWRLMLHRHRRARSRR